MDMNAERVLDYENMLVLGLVPPVSREGSTVSGHSDASILDQAASPVDSGRNLWVYVLFAVLAALLGISAFFAFHM